MRFPKSVNIAGHVIPIKWGGVSSDSLGEWHPLEQEIHLSHDLQGNPALSARILRHEMLHATLHLSGLSFCSSFDEEPIVRCIDTIFWPAWESISHLLED